MADWNLTFGSGMGDLTGTRVWGRDRSRSIEVDVTKVVVHCSLCAGTMVFRKENGNWRAELCSCVNGSAIYRAWA